jgi:hypothetical protein
MSKPTMFNKSDRKFLKSAGISVDDTALDADRLALANRIAKHQAPGQQVKVDAQAAKRQLIRLALQQLLDATGAHDATAATETPSETSPTFSPSDMESRWKRLKEEGKVPPLAAVLKLMQKEK